MKILALAQICWIGFADPSDARLLAQYQVRVAENLRAVDVVVRRLPGIQIEQLRASRGNAGQLRATAGCVDVPTHTPQPRLRAPRNSRLLWPAALDCLTYRYPLKPADERVRVTAAQGWVMSSPNEWLWLPQLSASDHVLIDLQMPAGMQVSVPWQPMPNGNYRLAATARSGPALALFGDLNEQRIPVAGGHLHVVQPDTGQGLLPAAVLQQWLHGAANQAAAVAGRFPQTQLQVVVLPVYSDSDSPVPFGQVLRDQGDAVRFYANPDSTAAELLYDWTAVHEFAHVLLPYVRDKWVSEGFASYYQNILQARAGEYTEAQMWQRLLRSFSRADAIRQPSVPANYDRRSFWEMRMLVYWRGAALALQADVALRQQTGGAESLDILLQRLGACCLPGTMSWSANRLFAELDGHSEFSVLQDLAKTANQVPGMPDLDPLLANLGVIVGPSGRVRLNDSAPWAQLRRRLVSGSP